MELEKPTKLCSMVFVWKFQIFFATPILREIKC